MKFDSTIYLTNELGLKLGLDQRAIENCLRILNGFTITPSSIHYDEETESLSLILTLPNGKIEVYEATITPTTLNLRCGLKTQSDLSVRIKCSLTNLSSNIAICLSDGSPISGIYYFNSSAGKKDGRNQYGRYTYFDSETLSRLQYYSRREGTFLDYIIDTFPTNINALGFMPDNEIDSDIEPKAYTDRANRINKIIRNMSIELIKEMIKKVYVEPVTENTPISI